ncbi:MAG: hypothetical protein QME72_22950, partial [Rhodococcus sp. (in: high G+C Gram-positive bacteria)]|nr:hypothetical protein [Rhodococcus sp. (in: high G+C Gram-positive bacteria)]
MTESRRRSTTEPIGFFSTVGRCTTATAVVFAESAAVEFGLAGNGPVSYTVRYVDEAIRYGTSEPLAVPGRSVLQVDLSGTSTDSDDTFSSYAGPERVRGGAESAI